MSNSNTARRKMKKRVRDILGNARPVQFFPVTGAVDFLSKDDGDRRFWPLPGAQAEAASNFHKQALAADRMAKQMDAAMVAAGHVRGIHDEWAMSVCAISPPTEPLTTAALERMIEALPPAPSLFAMSRGMLDTVLPIVEPREWVIQPYHGPMLKSVHEIEAAWRRDMLADGFVEVEPGEWFNEAQDVRIWRDEAPIGSVGGVRSEITD